MSITFHRAERPPFGVRLKRICSPEDRYWSHVQPDGACYRWNGGGTRRGYGQFKVGEFMVYVHRWAYEHFVGPIPEGMHIDHLCNNRWCVKPTHLEPVTQRENNRRVALRNRGVAL